MFCEPEILHFKKVNKSVLEKITYDLEDHDHKGAIFNGKGLTFTSKLLKVTFQIFQIF